MIARAVFLTSFFVAAACAADKPNVVIFYTDDHGTLDANCFGSTDLITPNIDRLAREGVRFTQHYAHRRPQRSAAHQRQDSCQPTQAVVLTVAKGLGRAGG